MARDAFEQVKELDDALRAAVHLFIQVHPPAQAADPLLKVLDLNTRKVRRVVDRLCAALPVQRLDIECNGQTYACPYIRLEHAAKVYFASPVYSALLERGAGPQGVPGEKDLIGEPHLDQRQFAHKRRLFDTPRRRCLPP